MISANGSSRTRRMAAPRSSRGCWTCKEKKVKCDESQPVCSRCTRLGLLCDFRPRSRKPYPQRKRAQAVITPGEAPAVVDQDGREVSTLKLLDDSSSITELLGGQESASHRHLNSISSTREVTACSFAFGVEEQEAVRYFRQTFARRYHTKNPEFNVLSIIYLIATQSPLTMHMVIAIARREMLFFQSDGLEESEDDEIIIKHYTAVLRSLADFVDGQDSETGLDAILSTIWLMLLYEQNFGDSIGSALKHHLSGLASIVNDIAGNALTLPSDQDHQSRSVAKTIVLSGSICTNSVLSLFSARMLVWIAFLDAAASSAGLGGDFNAALHRLLGEHAKSCTCCKTQPGLDVLKSFAEVQRYSNLLFSRIWGDSYPVHEMIDDIDNHKVFSLYGQCCQLRYMITHLHDLRIQDSSKANDYQRTIELALRETENNYAEYLMLAEKLTTETGHCPRLLKNVRYIVPYYFSVVLLYLRCLQGQTPSFRMYKRELAIRVIINLAFQGYKLEGDEAMLRIAWPLFMVRLETHDLLHREWVTLRLQSLRKYGKNYRRAATFAVEFSRKEAEAGCQLDLQHYLVASGFERFVIS